MNNSKPTLVTRTVTRVDATTGHRSRGPLSEYRHCGAYVLLGDPGAGKTTAFEVEAEDSQGLYIRARDFATFDLSQWKQQTVIFIDGLDEMRASGGDGRTPLDDIRRRLEQLGRPRFRLSCREADWLGASDRRALEIVAPDGLVETLHLDPLSETDIHTLLRASGGIDPEAFVGQATVHGLGELLENPHTLGLLVRGVGADQWPSSRSTVYDLACSKLLNEPNVEHRSAIRGLAPSSSDMLGAAGFLSAVQLISGIAGYALDEMAADEDHPVLGTFTDPPPSDLFLALKTNLFREDGENRRTYVHRSVAEFLAARFISNRVEGKGLSITRVMALVTAQDGGVVSDLRGLAAWLAVHCIPARGSLISRDPLALVLYGDVRPFTSMDKQALWEALRGESMRYFGFRSENWVSEPFGALGTADMEPLFARTLSSESRDDGHQAFIDCVLDAVLHGDTMPSLTGAIAKVAADRTYWSGARTTAIDILMKSGYEGRPHLLALLEGLMSGEIEDREDELLGSLLLRLYPSVIPAAKIFDYWHQPKSREFFGRYWMFWRSSLVEASSLADLPVLLDQLTGRQSLMQDGSTHLLQELAGDLLVKTLVVHGDSIESGRLFDWLGAGLDQHSHSEVDRDDATAIREWLSARPDRYMDVIERSKQICSSQQNFSYCMHKMSARLYGATPPSNSFVRFIRMAVQELEPEVARYLFDEAVGNLRREGQGELTLEHLDILGSWVTRRPEFESWLEPWISSRLDSWRRDDVVSERERAQQRRERKTEWLRHLASHVPQIEQGVAPPKVLYDLAIVYRGLAVDVEGETPRERLQDFLDHDEALIAKVHEGFINVLGRPDLPTVKEILELELKARMHFIRSPSLIGADLAFERDPDQFLRRDHDLLAKLIAFRLVENVGNEPEWFLRLVDRKPELVGAVLLKYAVTSLSAGKEHIAGLYPLSHDERYAQVARLILPQLLEEFPLRSKKLQLASAMESLIKGALKYLDDAVLLALVNRKVKLKSMDSSQRVYWLACGVILDSSKYLPRLLRFVADRPARREVLSAFFYRRWDSEPSLLSRLHEHAIGALIQALGRFYSSKRETGGHWVSPEMESADLVRSLIGSLGASTSEATGLLLERLIGSEQLINWEGALRSALHAHRIARRKAALKRIGPEQVSRSLSNLQPANAADLAAVALEHLRDIAVRVRHGETNDYRQYWSYDPSNKKLSKPKPENDCRDALLSDLKFRLARLKVEAVKEGYYAEEARADIRLSYGGAGGFNLPIEIKKDSHKNLWSAVLDQLISRYVRDPGAEGYGIYAVFWFGGQQMPPPPVGTRPRTAEDLEARLRSLLKAEDRNRIQICVIDCELPIHKTG